MKKIVEALKELKIKNFIILTIAGIINAFGVTVFLMPVKLYDSGLSGTAMLLSQITPASLSLSVFILILNVPVFIFGLKKQGLTFTVYGIYTVGIYSLFAWLITDVIPLDVRFSSPFAGKDLLLCAIFGGIIAGTGVGLAIRFGGAIDGVEVMAVIFAKKLGLTVGNFNMAYNVVLYICCGIALKSWTLPLYSIVTYMAALKTVDYIVEGIDRAKCAMIVTSKPDEVCTALSEKFEEGMTEVDARGGYSGTEKTIIYFVINRFQVTQMKNIVHNIDKTAFISIHEVSDVFKANQIK